MRALLGDPEGGMQSQKHFVRKVKKSNSIKCIFSNKSKLWPGKSKTSKFNIWNSGKSNFFTKHMSKKSCKQQNS